VDFLSLLFGSSVVAISLGLESHRRLHDLAMTCATEIDRIYVNSRKKNRCWTNAMLALIGGLAAAAGFVGRGPIWIVLWATIPLVVVVVMTLAVADVFRTQRYLARKIPELRAETLGREGCEIEKR
jgi:energy-converting hydrogenase Eha subunit E